MERGGKLAIRGDEQEEGAKDRAGIGAGRDTGKRSIVGQRRPRKGCGYVTGSEV
jgi:hypothetical protein